MTSKKIYLVRHGQTDFNLKGIVQGSGIDSVLNETGKEQATAFYDVYRETAFDKVYTSKLKRSLQSVNSFIEQGVPHEQHTGLNEINWGDKEGMQITPAEDEYYQWLLKQWQKGNTNLPIEGGESPEDVANRQLPILKKILEASEERTILVCMHGRAIRILLCQMLNYPLHAMDIFEHKNLGLYILHYTGTMARIDDYNNTDHLTRLSYSAIQNQLVGN